MKYAIGVGMAVGGTIAMNTAGNALGMFVIGLVWTIAGVLLAVSGLSERDKHFPRK